MPTAARRLISNRRVAEAISRSASRDLAEIQAAHSGLCSGRSFASTAVLLGFGPGSTMGVADGTNAVG